MKPRYVVRAGLFVMALSAGLLAAGFAGLWLFPTQVFGYAASAAQRAGITVRLPSVRGNPLSGWTFDRVSVGGAGFSLSARRLFIDIDWATLARGRAALDALWVDGLAVAARPIDEKPKEKKKSASLPAIHDLRVTDGRVSFTPAEGDGVDVRRLELQARVDPTSVTLYRFSLQAYENDFFGRADYDMALKTGSIDAGAKDCLKWPGVAVLDRHCVNRASARVVLDGDKVTLERVSASVSRSTVSASGFFNIAALSGRFNVTSQGPLVVKAEAKGDRAGWHVAGEARASNQALQFSGAVRLGAVPSCDLDVRAADVPADFVPGLPPALGMLTGRVSVAASGKRPSDMNGQATLHLAASRGPGLDGTVRIVDGAASALVAVSSGGLTGKIDGRWHLARKSGDMRAKLHVEGAGLRAWTGVQADGNLDVMLNGRWPELVWKFDADLKNVGTDDVRVARVVVSGVGDRLSPPAGRLKIDLEKVTQGENVVEQAHIAVDGSAARHRMDVFVESEGRVLRGTATGALNGARWTSTWNEFDVRLGEVWTSRQVFYLDAGPAGVTVRGLRLASGEARFSVDGGVGRGQFQDLRIRADAVEIGPLAKAFKSSVDVGGTASLNAAATGPLKSPEARVTASISNLTVSGKDAGTLNAAARVSGGRLLVEQMTLAGAAGNLDADGSIPLAFGGKRSPPVRFHIRTTGLDPAALPLPEGVAFEKARIEGDLAISAGPGVFSAQGRLSLTAARIRLEAQGLDLADVELRLTADGDELTIAKAVARTGKGTISLDGTIGARDVAVGLRARKFEIDHPTGVSVRTDADLALAGTWDAPRLTGTVDIRQADVQPGKAKKEKKKRENEAAPPPAPRGTDEPSPLAADVRIVFDDDVWYKDGQSAIEFKGNLNVRKESGGLARIYGSVETIRGDYTFYGRTFVVERGQVSFIGDAPPNPALDIRATYVTDESNVKVHLDAKGTLVRPELTLSSEPPMEETDIVSVLVTGRPRGEGGSGAGSEDAARLMAANYLAERLRSKLQTRLDVDQLKFNLTEEGAAQVTVGENVTEDLYVSYGRTLGAEGERKLTAEYTLTPIWSLYGTTSSVGRYVIDLLFRFGFH